MVLTFKKDISLQFPVPQSAAWDTDAMVYATVWLSEIEVNFEKLVLPTRPELLELFSESKQSSDEETSQEDIR